MRVKDIIQLLVRDGVAVTSQIHNAFHGVGRVVPIALTSEFWAGKGKEVQRSQSWGFPVAADREIRKYQMRFKILFPNSVPGDSSVKTCPLF